MESEDQKKRNDNQANPEDYLKSKFLINHIFQFFGKEKPALNPALLLHG